MRTGVAVFWSRFGKAVTGLLRWSSVLVVLFWSVAAAHGVSYNDLGHLTLCLDASTVQVVLESNDAGFNAHYAALIAERLRQALPRTLNKYRVPFTEKPSCVGEAGFVYTLFYVHWQYPAAADPSFIYAAALQVGEAPGKFEAKPEFVLRDERFDAYTAARLFESDLDEPFDQVLPADNEQMMEELAAAWWDDRSYQQDLRRARQQDWLVRLSIVSGLLTAGIVLVGSYFFRRRRQPGV